ncbi:hypothetical protein [Streptomyces lavendulae]|uniref:hypothetical protein n=1 Tax=Streptomyces lavendulae TaxID=1914 RepID=UPI0036ED5EA8
MMIGTYHHDRIEAKLAAGARLARPEIDGPLGVMDEVLAVAARRAVDTFDAEWPSLFLGEVVDMLLAPLIPVADRPHLGDEMQAAALIFQAPCDTLAYRA